MKKYSNDKEIVQLKTSDIPRVRMELMEKQGNKCLVCGKEFSDSIKPCLDHNHSSWMVRGVLCNSCNVLEAKYYNAFVRVGARNKGIDYKRLLRGLAKYFDIEETNYVYPVKRKKVKLRRKKK
jgi:hypothetical protein